MEAWFINDKITEEIDGEKMRWRNYPDSLRALKGHE
jgi:hypothetical protein